MFKEHGNIRSLPPVRDFFVPHPNLDDAINRNICQSEIEGGVRLDHLPVDATLEVETENRVYLLQNRGNGNVLIAGHPRYCPQPVVVRVHGSTWGGSMIKTGFIGRGMCLEFHHSLRGVIHTSRIREIRELPKGQEWPERIK